MQVTLDVPEDLAALFAAEPAALSRAVLESLALEGVRSERLTVAQARRLLGIESRYEMDGFLKEHGVMLPLTIEDIRQFDSGERDSIALALGDPDAHRAGGTLGSAINAAPTATFRFSGQ